MSNKPLRLNELKSGAIYTCLLSGNNILVDRTEETSLGFGTCLIVIGVQYSKGKHREVDIYDYMLAESYEFKNDHLEDFVSTKLEMPKLGCIDKQD